MTAMAFNIDVQLACDSQLLPLSRKTIIKNIEHWVGQALKFTGVMWLRSQPWHASESFSHAAQLTVRIVDIDEGESLNRTYRSGQSATNVLSFPFDDPFQLAPPLLGDIVICAPVLISEANQQNKDLAAHWAHLVVHGVLHLLGYDHLDDEQASVMEAQEINILALLGYANPYSEQDA